MASGHFVILVFSLNAHPFWIPAWRLQPKLLPGYPVLRHNRMFAHLSRETAASVKLLACIVRKMRK